MRAVAYRAPRIFLQQLERRDPDELAADEEADEEGDIEMGDSGADQDDGEDDDADSASSSSSSDEDGEDEDEEEDEEADLELRRKIEEALRVNGIAAATGDSDEDSSDEELMDDEQMLAIDEQLSAAFRARAAEKGNGKGKPYSSALLPHLC